jgi:hypothetical protein
MSVYLDESPSNESRMELPLNTTQDCWLCGMRLPYPCHLIPEESFDLTQKIYSQVWSLGSMKHDDVENRVICEILIARHLLPFINQAPLPVCPNDRMLYDLEDWTLVPTVEHLIPWIREAEATVLNRHPHHHPVSFNQ